VDENYHMVLMPMEVLVFDDFEYTAIPVRKGWRDKTN
jgi:hypothetical protein